eukprot:5746594-Amphidinium_carterae.1
MQPFVKVASNVGPSLTTAAERALAAKSRRMEIRATATSQRGVEATPSSRATLCAGWSGAGCQTQGYAEEPGRVQTQGFMDTDVAGAIATAAGGLTKEIESAASWASAVQERAGKNSPGNAATHLRSGEVD